MTTVRLAAIHTEDVTGAATGSVRLPEDRILPQVLELLNRNVLCSMATVDAGGCPHINAAYFSYTDTLDLYFLSHPASRHCRNLVASPSMAMTIFSSAQNWTEPDQGLQLFGTCEQTYGPSAAEAERSYSARFEGYARWHAALKDGDPACQYNFYRFRVTAMKILDERAFGEAAFVVAEVRRD